MSFVIQKVKGSDHEASHSSGKMRYYFERIALQSPHEKELNS